MQQTLTDSAQSRPNQRRFDLLIMAMVGMLVVVVGVALFLNEEQNIAADISSEAPLRVIYLAPSDSNIRNLYITEVESGKTRQFTALTEGIIDYAVSPNSEWVAFTAYHIENAYDIWIQNIDDGQIIQMTNCAEAEATCSGPSWSADSTRIAYTRRELAIGFNDTNSEHVWVVDIRSQQSVLVFNDLSLTAHTPRWSPVGEKLAMVLKNQPAILVYNYATEQSTLIGSVQNVSGVFAPDGNRLAYPLIASGAAGTSYYTHLELATLDSGDTIYLSGEQANPVDDLSIAFHPQDESAAITRRYLDNRYTEGGQVYLLDLTTLQETPLVVDRNYSHSYVNWSADGSYLVMQRFDFRNTRPVTEVWIYEIASGTLRQLSTNAYQPAFLP